MDADRWRQIDDCYHSALERPVPERAAFLAEACGNDPDLRREVESLLAHEGQADELLENPAWNHLAPSDETGTLASAALPVGLMMAEYRIAGRLGSGGMGQVYRATDTKLQRDVAIKVLAAEFAQNTAWMSRFQREARVLASLNHPNIAAIYGLEESGGVRAIAMELVEGPTLAERMARGKVPIAEALAIARQIAEALEYAHEKGIVHRDLKPANVKLRADGMVKVLDFGLAKAVASKEMPPATATHAGAIMGTPAYMAPEQAAGLPVDRRTDIWAFGVVLFEMLAGRQVYARKTTLETLAAVARDEPQWHELPTETPAEIRKLLHRCLDRNPKNRLRNIGEARIAIEATLARKTSPVDSAPGAGSARRLWLAWSVAAVAILGLAAVSFEHFREQPPGSNLPMRFQIPLPANAAHQSLLSLSPDGRKLAFLAGDRLWVHSLESGESTDLTACAGAPCWSPDSRYIGFVTPERKLKKIEASGGPVQTLADIRTLWAGGTWNQEDVILFADRGIGIMRVPASGGFPVPITARDRGRRETDHDVPSFLPDGRHFVYVRRSSDPTKSAIYLGSVDAKPEQQSSKPLVRDSWPAQCVPSAETGVCYLLFVSGGTLMAQPFDNRRLELTGQAERVAEQINDGRLFSASANNVLVFEPTQLSEHQLTWYNRDGKVLGTVGEPGDYQHLEISPDGRQLATAKGRLLDTVLNIWLLDLSRGRAGTRFTFGSPADNNPAWSPDGTRIVFSSNRDGGGYDLYQKPANGASDEEVLFKSSEDTFASSWSRDGRFLLYSVLSAKMKYSVGVLPMGTDRKPVGIPFLVTEFNEQLARFSPDGRWVAYVSDESGHYEVYVRPFSMNSAGTAVETGGKWQISDGYGFDPRWRDDGRELYYLSLKGPIMAVEVATAPTFRAGKPQLLGVPVPSILRWGAAPDGKSFLVPVIKSDPQPYTVVLNWQAGLKKR